MPQNPAAKIGTSRTTSKEGILTEISVFVLGERPSERDRRITTIDCQNITLLLIILKALPRAERTKGISFSLIIISATNLENSITDIFLRSDLIWNNTERKSLGRRKRGRYAPSTTTTTPYGDKQTNIFEI